MHVWISSPLGLQPSRPHENTLENQNSEPFLPFPKAPWGLRLVVEYARIMRSAWIKFQPVRSQCYDFNNPA